MFFDMELQLFGINHKTSDVSEREKLIINESNQILLDNHLKKVFKTDIESFFGLSTCNRTELYLYGKSGISLEVYKEVIKFFDVEQFIQDNFYFLNNHDALVHMCKVASGIDSQVLGEQEIFGQFKFAMKIAQDYNFLNKNLLFFSNKVIEISKKARTLTGIGLNPLSVSGLTIKLIKSIFEKPDIQNILVVGAGSLSRDVLKSLHDKGINKIKSVNRSVKRIRLSNDFEILSTSLEFLHKELETSDIIIASSTTDVPLIGKGAVENALIKRGNKPLLIIDLGVPRNVEDEVRTIEQVYLYSIDDIEKITQDNLGLREIEAEKALNIIAVECQSAIDAHAIKNSKDILNNQLNSFLNSLSSEEIDQFKIKGDFTELVKSLKTLNIKNPIFNDYQDIKELDDHIVHSMIKRYFNNA